MDDYYEPWTYDYQNLFNAPEGDDQPTARRSRWSPASRSTDRRPGPNWDDDLGGSEIYAKNDPNLEGLSEEQRSSSGGRAHGLLLLAAHLQPLPEPVVRRLVPLGGALQARRGRHRPDRPEALPRLALLHISACPYKKTFYNWQTGKSEKCILCYPRLETGQAPACFHSCVGRIRYLGVLLYDADQIGRPPARPDEELVEAQRDMILDPHDPEVIAAARANGIHDDVIESAQKSPVYRFVKEWKIALPPHVEYRTFRCSSMCRRCRRCRRAATATWSITSRQPLSRHRRVAGADRVPGQASSVPGTKARCATPCASRRRCACTAAH